MTLSLTEMTGDPPAHDSSSGRDSVYHLSVSPSVSFRSGVRGKMSAVPFCGIIDDVLIVTSHHEKDQVCRPSPMLVQKMSTPEHGDSDSSRISTSTSLPDAGIT